MVRSSCKTKGRDLTRKNHQHTLEVQKLHAGSCSTGATVDALIEIGHFARRRRVVEIVARWARAKDCVFGRAPGALPVTQQFEVDPDDFGLIAYKKRKAGTGMNGHVSHLKPKVVVVLWLGAASIA